MNKKAIWLALALIVLIGSWYLYKNIKVVEPAEQEKTLKIASNLPMTGDLGFYGQYVKSGLSMALDDLKDSLKNISFKIDIDYADNKGSAKDAVSIFNLQKQNDFDIYMSGVTAQTMSIRELVDKTKSPHIIWSFEPFLLNNGENFIRPWIDMEDEGKQFIKYMEKVKPKSVAFLYQNLSSTQTQFNKILLPYANNKGIKVTYNEAYDITTTNFRDILTKVVASKPDLIITYGFQNHLVEIVKGLNSLKYKKDGNILCSFDFLDVQNLLEPSLLDGIITNVPHYLIDDSEKLKNWKAKFKIKYNRDPLFTDAYAYDLGYTLYYSLKLNQENSHLNYYNCLIKTEFEGMTGFIKYKENGQLIYNVQPSIFKNNSFSKMEL